MWFQQAETNRCEMLIPKVTSNFNAPRGNEDLDQYPGQGNARTKVNFSTKNTLSLTLTCMPIYTCKHRAVLYSIPNGNKSLVRMLE